MVLEAVLCVSQQRCQLGCILTYHFPSQLSGAPLAVFKVFSEEFYDAGTQLQKIIYFLCAFSFAPLADASLFANELEFCRTMLCRALLCKADFVGLYFIM